MGRKPNPLILEFFQRGQKLEDASNRYQHTCKACGEKFPKGRIDSLTAHLFRKCPAIPYKDRERAALLQLNGSPDATGPGGAKDSNPDPGHAQPKQNGPTARGQELASAVERNNWTPLQTLAEVSRQIDLSEKRPPTPQSFPADGTVLGSHAPEERVGADGSNYYADDWLMVDSKDTTDEATTLPPIQSWVPVPTTRSLSPPLPGLSFPGDMAVPPGFMPSVPPPPPGMALDMQSDFSRRGFPLGPDPLEPELAGASQNASLSDKFFHNRGLGIRTASTWSAGEQGPPVDPLLLDGSQDLRPSTSQVPPRAATYPRPIAANPSAPQRSFTSEFSAAGKQARSKVRGRFSPGRRKEVQECSGESPCYTCRSVESARLWKQPCIRTRIADELELYSAGVYSLLAVNQIKRTKDQVQFHHFSGSIEATHFLDTPVYISFGALEGGNPQANADLPMGDQSPKVLLLDSDGDDLPAKFELYTKNLMETLIQREPSKFMNPTLTFALDLSRKKKDSLLSRALELWAVIHIWVDLEMRWITFENPDPSNAHRGRRAIDEQSSNETYQLLCHQLRALAEKRASQISKSLLNELERRLLQRGSGLFETYLVAICLLNCVERTSWLFQTWNHDEFMIRWPLDRKPLYYSQQSERFGDMLHMLLKMRGLPPKTCKLSDGILATDTDETARQYFEFIHMDSKTVEERQSAVFDPQDSRSLELKLCAKLLLPS